MINSDSFQKALHTLEFDKILDMLCSCCRLESGCERIRKTVPLTDGHEILRLLKQTSEAKALLAVKGAPSMSAHISMPDIVSRAEKGAVLTPGELLRVASMLSSASAIKSFGEKANENSMLFPIFSHMLPNKQLDQSITHAIENEDMISDDASDELNSIRRKIRNSGARIRETLSKYTGGAYSTYLQDNIITIRNGRYVVPVKVEYKNEVKGLVHDTSSSGATVFIEPLAVVELNNDIKMLENEEHREIERILTQLSFDVAAYADSLLLDYMNITEMSVIFAKAELSFKLNAAEPKLNLNGYSHFIKARHPLLEKEKVVPIEIMLGGNFDTLVITGPNTGGKTVSIKTFALLAMMAQSGFHIPADEGSEFCVYKDILCDIGDEQSIEQSLSTFSSHMINIISILKRCGEGSLALFDELGAGTDPVEGAALAVSILEYVKRSGAKCLATTHYAELKTYALETDRVENASCEFDINSLKPTYRLIIGTPGRSNAFLISERLGLDTSIIKHAETLIDTSSLRFEKVVEKLEADRIAMEESRRIAEKQRDETGRMHSDALEERDRLIASAQKELERAKTEATRLIKTAKAQSDAIFIELSELKNKSTDDLLKDDLDAKRAAFRDSLRGIEKEIDNRDMPEPDDDYILPRELVKGDKVLVVLGNDKKKHGVVEKVNGDEASVICGSIRMKLKTKALRLVSGLAAAESNAVKRSATSSLRPSVKSEIDLRGLTGEDAWFSTDKYLDDAILGGLNSVTLIHGKGTGALRKAMWDYLKRDSRVASYRMGAYGEGDSGVTVVEFKKKK